MASLLASRTFVTHLTGLLGLVGVNVAVPNSPAMSIAVAVITGVTQAAHAYKEVRMQPKVTSIDTGIRMAVPTLTNAAGTEPIVDHTEGPLA